MQRKIIAFLHIGCTVYPAISPPPISGLPLSHSPTPDSRYFPSPPLRILLFSFSPTPDSRYFPSPHLRIPVIFSYFPPRPTPDSS